MAGRPVSAEDVAAVRKCVLETLDRGRALDWMVPAGSLEWSCRETACHIADVTHIYGVQILVRKQESYYVRMLTRPIPGEFPLSDVLEAVDGGLRVLEAAIRTTPPDARAYHPYGLADPEGFAAGGCLEALVHCMDVATGLELTFASPPETCQRLLQRLFQHSEQGMPDTSDPWSALLVATGRRPSADGQRRTSWRWNAARLRTSSGRTWSDPNVVALSAAPYRALTQPGFLLAPDR